jgi:hypothetical protein
MGDERTIGICIPTFERPDMTIEAFVKVHDDPRVKSILINDDSSEWGSYERLQRNVEPFKKVKLCRNFFNIDCAENKMRSIWLSDSDWNVLLDSDNIIDTNYLDRIFEYEWRPDIILTPDFAAPNFDFRAYAGLLITKENVVEYLDKPMFETMLNANNFFVNREKYLEVYGDDKTDPVTSDSIYFCYKWLAAGNKIQVVKGLNYFHRVHRGHYQTNVHRTAPGFHESVLQKLRELR